MGFNDLLSWVKSFGKIDNSIKDLQVKYLDFKNT